MAERFDVDESVSCGDEVREKPFPLQQTRNDPGTTGYNNDMPTVNDIANNVGVLLQQLDQPCTDKQLLAISKLVPNLRQYCVALELTEQEINAIETNPKLSYSLQILECLRTWSRKNSHSPRGTVRHLMQTCINEHNAKLAGDVCKILLQREDVPQPRNLLGQEISLVNSRLSCYKKYLCSRYKAQSSISSTQWPPVPTTKVIKLAMIKKKKVQRGRIDDEFVRLSITGKGDDILHKKTPVELEDTFSEAVDERNVVLIEGAPGSGKSTLALHICQEWGKGNLFQKYDAVILVRLRDPLVQKAKTLADILPCDDEAMAIDVHQNIKSNYGDGTLFVLDGWDELPSDFPQDSIIHKLFQPEFSRHSSLHKCDVIVTSRPVSSAKLHPLVSARVEVLGFTPDELNKYFTECLNGDTGAVQSLLDRIRENPVVEGCCCLPLNAAIIAHVYLSGDHTLPSSNHEIFTSVVRFCLSRYLQDRLGRAPHKAKITSLQSLPRRLQSPFHELCKLAYFGIVKNKFTFVPDDLKSARVSLKVSEIGLLQAVPSILVESQEIYYGFLHQSIQEVLAAVHISHMPSGEQISVFQELFGQPRFSAVFQFYAGITKLKTYRRLLNNLPNSFFRKSPRAVLDIVTSFIKQGSEPLLVSILHCLYEAEDPSLCQYVAQQLNGKLNLSSTPLSPLDCLSLGYFLSITCTTTKSLANGLFNVNLSGCSIGDLGCKFLTRGLCKCFNAHSILTSQLDMNLMYKNNIHEEGAHHLAELITNTTVIHSLNLNLNPIGAEGLKSLCVALLTNTSLTRFDLCGCSIVTSEDNGPALTEMLIRNNTIKYLNLSGCTLPESVMQHFAYGMKENKCIEMLNLNCCELTDAQVAILSTGLNNYLTKLFLHENDKITVSGINDLASHLFAPARLRKISIPLHLKFCINPIFGPVNEERRRNGLPMIVVKAW